MLEMWLSLLGIWLVGLLVLDCVIARRIRRREREITEAMHARHMAELERHRKAMLRAVALWNLGATDAAAQVLKSIGWDVRERT